MTLRDRIKNWVRWKTKEYAIKYGAKAIIKIASHQAKKQGYSVERAASFLDRRTAEMQERIESMQKKLPVKIVPKLPLSTREDARKFVPEISDFMEKRDRGYILTTRQGEIVDYGGPAMFDLGYGSISLSDDSRNLIGKNLESLFEEAEKSLIERGLRELSENPKLKEFGFGGGIKTYLEYDRENKLLRHFSFSAREVSSKTADRILILLKAQEKEVQTVTSKETRTFTLPESFGLEFRRIPNPEPERIEYVDYEPLNEFEYFFWNIFDKTKSAYSIASKKIRKEYNKTMFKTIEYLSPHITNPNEEELKRSLFWPGKRLIREEKTEPIELWFYHPEPAKIENKKEPEKPRMPSLLENLASLTEKAKAGAHICIDLRYVKEPLPPQIVSNIANLIYHSKNTGILGVKNLKKYDYTAFNHLQYHGVDPARLGFERFYTKRELTPLSEKQTK